MLLALVLCAGWETVIQEDGLVVEAESVSGSSFENLRITGTTTAAPEAFIKAWWGKASDFSASPEVVKREIFLENDTERLYWDLIRPPAPASERDYVMHLQRKPLEVKFESVDDKRKPAGQYVRMVVRGSVVVTPDPKGARITYVVFTDIGGAIPAAFARGAQRRASLNLVREIRRRAEAAR